MALYLVQHGKSLSKDVDPERSLSEEGIGEVKLIANVAKNYGVHVSLIKHSSKKRAQQTAEIIAGILNPENGLEETDKLDPTENILAILDDLNSSEDIMFVGHLPLLEKLVSFLITESMDKIVFKIQNAGIVCLDQDADTENWFIKWTLMPNIG